MSRLILCGVFVIAIDGCSKQDDAKQNDIKRSDPSQVDPFAAPADVHLTADELAREESAGEKLTQEKYKGKVLEITGVVKGVNRNIFLEPMISVRGKDKDPNWVSIITIEQTPWDKVAPGQSVKLKVIYQERHGSTWRVGGPILEITGKSNPTLSADEFAKEYEANPKAADKKYAFTGDDNVILSGEIVEATERDEYGLPAFFLKTGTKIRLKCSPDRESAKGLNAGMKVKIIGSCSFFKNPQVEINNCVVIEILK